MSATNDLLFELGTEELPPKSLLTLSRALQTGVEAGLNKAGLAYGEFVSYATPRRLAFLVKGLATAQPDQTVEKRGPAINAAYNADGSLTKAAEGFVRSCGTTPDKLTTLKTDKGEWLVFKQDVKGAATATLIPDIIRQSLAALPIAKRMRWGAGVAEFVRPAHWVVLLFGDAVIETSILDLPTGRTTKGHRFHKPGIITVASPTAYAEQLRSEGQVIANYAERMEAIRAGAGQAAASVNGEAHIDEGLLEEIAALVEWPVPVLGGFEARFLELPAEVLITTMQENQKYFPVKNAQGGLLPWFITFSNIDSSRIESVREGNERVVRPRLTDAEFFWKQDRKKTLEDRVPNLANITFQKTLGSLLDKTHRVQRLAAHIAGELEVESALVERAALLAKADLLTEMVGEFTNLQGTMGRYYALAEGEPEDIAWAIEEQYLPKVSGGVLPVTQTGQMLALAEKLDTLTGIFSAGLIPTGDKDPYALRRAALGAIRLLVECRLDLDLPQLLAFALEPFTHSFDREKTQQQVHEFILDRLKGYSLERGFSHDEFDAVLSVQPPRLLDFVSRLNAVKEFRTLPEAESLAAANKRIRNILRKAEEAVVANVDDHILKDVQEINLLQSARDAREDVLPLLRERDYTAALRRLAGLRDDVDAFFDHVMVMCEDLELRKNRLGLLAIIEGLFLDIADISRLQVG
ncbi:glycyl-tRNA synthetase beta chain [Anaerolineae bacterium]|nr:glycyl-tRNA synthetase beta chain [Anaerolineae bacterium]